MTDVQARALLILWETGEFDTSDLQHITGLEEAAIDRLLHAYRGTVRELYREARA